MEIFIEQPCNIQLDTWEAGCLYYSLTKQGLKKIAS